MGTRPEKFDITHKTYDSLGCDICRFCGFLNIVMDW